MYNRHDLHRISSFRQWYWWIDIPVMRAFTPNYLRLILGYEVEHDHLLGSLISDLNTGMVSTLKCGKKKSITTCNPLTNCTSGHTGYKHTLYSVYSSWNVMAHGDARKGKWRGNWRSESVTSTLHTTSEHGVSSITTADAHTSAASSRLNWRPRRFKRTPPYRRKTKYGFWACAYHISNGLYLLLRHVWLTVQCS